MSLISGLLSLCASIALLLAVYFEYSILDALYNDSSILPSTAATYMIASILAFFLLTFFILYMKWGNIQDEGGGRFFDALGIFITAAIVSLMLIVAAVATGAYD